MGRCETPFPECAATTVEDNVKAHMDTTSSNIIATLENFLILYHLLPLRTRDCFKEKVIEYYKQVFSIAKLAEMADTSIAQIMQILRGLDEELEDIEEELIEIEEMSRFNYTMLSFIAHLVQEKWPRLGSQTHPRKENIEE
jgi:Mg2+ and Co2+ transporter CorA